MNSTLRDYLKLADETHEYLDKFCVALSQESLESKILELQAAVKNIQSVAKRIADISNIATRILNRKKAAKRTTAAKTSKHGKLIDPYPTEFDHATLRTLYPEKDIEIVNNIHIPIKVAESLADIPVTNLYYVPKLNQFALNVNGVILKGNLGNLVDYQTENSARCEYGVECKSFVKKTKCPYYHDPEDFIKHNLPVPDYTRSFTIGSWLYSKNRNPRTYFTRHLGSKDRLVYDLHNLKSVQYREEISNREGQLIHDLLIYMILNSKGLLERYPHWTGSKTLADTTFIKSKTSA